jgi:hypothetical protein
MKLYRRLLALDSLGLDTDNDTLTIQRDNVVLTASAVMSDTEHLNVSLVAASFLDSLDDFSVVVLDVPILDANLLYLAGMVDQVCEFVCGLVSACFDLLLYTI